MLSNVSSRSAGVVVKRAFACVPVLLGVSALTFLIVDLLPGNAAQQLIGIDGTPEQVALLESELKLDRPTWRRYWEWLSGAVGGDLGNSLASKQPVAAIFRERIPVTLELVFVALVLSLGVAVPFALWTTLRPGGFADRVSAALSMVSLSTPNYVLALLLGWVFSVHMALFPSIGFVPFSESPVENLRSLTLPALAVAFPMFGLYTRFLSGDLLEQMRGEAYIVTASVKGLRRGTIVLRHAFRNSLFGLLTIVGVNVGTLIGGTVIIEQIFALPGVGQLLLQAINMRDVVVVQAVVLLLAVVTVLVSLTVDLLYTVLDPRVRYAA
jgi:peptide/nickel transport system permease protein